MDRDVVARQECNHCTLGRMLGPKGPSTLLQKSLDVVFCGDHRARDHGAGHGAAAPAAAPGSVRRVTPTAAAKAAAKTKAAMYAAKAEVESLVASGSDPATVECARTRAEAAISHATAAAKEAAKEAGADDAARCEGGLAEEEEEDTFGSGYKASMAAARTLDGFIRRAHTPSLPGGESGGACKGAGSGLGRAARVHRGKTTWPGGESRGAGSGLR